MRLSSRIQDCGYSPIHKFAGLAVSVKKSGKTIYELNVGQPDIRVPECYFTALNNFHETLLGYTDAAGDLKLIQAIQKSYELLGAALNRKHILVTTGGTEALQIAFSCILDEGDEVIIPEPFYPNYKIFIRLTGGSIRPVPGISNETDEADFLRYLESAVNPRTKAILLSNPSNPTGIVLDHTKLALLAEFSQKRGLFLIVDEVYRQFVYNGRKPESILALPGAGKQVIVIDSISKQYMACGARIGCLISRNEDFMAQALKWCQGRMSCSAAEQRAAAALYALPPKHFASARLEYNKRRRIMEDALREIPDIYFTRPDGAFYIMAALPVPDSEVFLNWLLTEFEDKGETVMFAPGRDFFETTDIGQNWIRLAYVLEESALVRAMELLTLGLKTYNRKVCNEKNRRNCL